MCGIFGASFQNVSRTEALEQLLCGIQNLEYRGYDSAGVAIQSGSRPEIDVCKCAGRVQMLQEKVQQTLLLPTADGTLSQDKTSIETIVGIAHTRWATHGPATDKNAHPHTSNDARNQFVIVHNGIVTNYVDLREFLEQQGLQFTTDTDSEVIAVLCTHVHRTMFDSKNDFDFAKLVYLVTSYLEGSYSLLILSSLCPNQLVATKRGSPLIVGLLGLGGTVSSLSTKILRDQSDRQYKSQTIDNLTVKNSVVVEQKITGDSFYFSSDTAALVPHVQNVMYLKDGVIAHVSSSNELLLYSPRSDDSVRPITMLTFHPLDTHLETISKREYEDFMLKEIMEQSNSVSQTLTGRVKYSPSTRMHQLHLGGLSNHWKYIEKARRLILFGCGSSYNVAVVIRALFEQSSHRPVQIELASDFVDRKPPVYRDDVCIFISQSGETADTIRALNYCRSEGDALCVGIVNTVGSSIARLTDCGLYLNCGKEVGVASTKAYTSQIVALVLIALKFETDIPLLDAVVTLPAQIQQTLEMSTDTSRRFANRLFEEDCRGLLLLGRSQQYATCREGALKIKEIAYVYTEAIASGELKHGSVALVDADAHLLVVATHDDAEGKVRMALSQLMARGGRPFVITDDPKLIEEFGSRCRDCLLVPKCSHPVLQCVLNVIPLQLIAYNLAKKRGYDVDKPRNLAKSVTVE